MPFLPASTPIPSPPSSFPKRGGEGEAAAEGGGAVVVAEVEVEAGKEAALVAEGAKVAVESSRHPVCRRDVCGGLSARKRKEKSLKKRVVCSA